MVRVLSIKINRELISMVTTLPLGIQWRKVDKAGSTFFKKNFFLNDEQLIETKMGLEGKAFPIPWMT